MSVNFVYEDGTEKSADLPDGVSVMEGALKSGIDGIDADCGGALSCATCHVRIPSPWRELIPPPCSAELEMLEFAVDPDDESRLSCQIIVRPDLEGMQAIIPKSQR